MAIITSINMSKKKGTPKTPISSIILKENHGLVGDAHAAPGLRQVSLLSQEDINDFKNNPKLKVELKPGIFGENIAVSGIDFKKLTLGDRLKIIHTKQEILKTEKNKSNEIILEVSKIGKECLVPCMIGKLTGDCIMPKKGVFAIVIKGGKISTGDSIELVKP